MPNKSFSKPQSFTTQTRLTQSNLINSSLDKSHNQINAMAQHIQNSQNKECQFLKLKNSQLNQTIKRMVLQIRTLEDSKVHLLSLNEKYVKVVNEYYRKPKISKAAEKEPLRSVLSNLEKDHRNLVKHCLAMEDEIQHYTQQMHKYNILKQELFTVNHTSAKELIDELIHSTKENQSLKSENNKLMFQLEKAKGQCKNIKKKKQESCQIADANNLQLEKYKSLIRATEQQSKDKQNKDAAKIYQLQLKVQKLEKQLRRNQQFVYKNFDLRGKLEMERVQNVHQCEQLKKQIAQYYPPRKSLNLRKINQGKHSTGVSYIDQ